MALSRSRRARVQRRRLKRVRAADNDLTAAQWNDLVAAWGACAYCGADNRALQRDCVLPISRGGRYSVGNVVPACATCNASKGNSEVTTWMRRKRLPESDFLARWAEIRVTLAVSAGTAEPDSTT